jgi:hypothetical protein
MKVLGNLTVNKDSSENYPFGANIQNETDTVNGTPVVREIYGDVLMNIYRLLELAKITPTNTEDNDTTQYQIVESLKKLPNSLNDIEQVLTLSGSVWSVPFDLSILPNRYFFIARASSDYVGSTTFKGSGTLELPFTSTGFNASDELLVIIDTTAVRAYSLSKLSQAPEFLNTINSYPLRYNSSSELYYFQNEKVFKNFQIIDLQNKIRVFKSDGSLKLINVNIMKNNAVCVVFNPSTDNYEFYAFSMLDLNTVIEVSTDIVQTFGDDYEPLFYCNNDYMFATNSCNTRIDDLFLAKLYFDSDNYTLNYVSQNEYDDALEKKENGCIYDNKLYIINDSGNLSIFDINTGFELSTINYTGILGYIFNYNDVLYINQNNIAYKVNL